MTERTVLVPPTRREQMSPEEQEFYRDYCVRDGIEDWDVLDEEKWSAYRRLESFRRIVAWWRGEGWRGYHNYIGTPIMYPGCSKETVDAVLSSPDVQRTIYEIAQQRARMLLACVRDGKVSPEYVKTYLKDPSVDEDPYVDPLRVTAAQPLERYLGDAKRPDSVSLTQNFYTQMRLRLERELTHKAREVVEVSAARMDSYVSRLTQNDVFACVWRLGERDARDHVQLRHACAHGPGAGAAARRPRGRGQEAEHRLFAVPQVAH